MRNLQKKKTVTMEVPVLRRMGAFAVDYLILSFFVLFPFERLINRQFNGATMSNLVSAFQSGAINVFFIVIISVFMGIVAFLYFIILETKFKQSIGKMFFNVKVGSIKTTTQVTQSQMITRTLGIVLVYVIPILALADALYALFNKEKQRFLEKISDTKTYMHVSI
ncbi:MAG: RDD family protein [Candidatus Woesearchaeota archaeon]